MRRSRIAPTREAARAKLKELQQSTFQIQSVNKTTVAKFLTHWLDNEVKRHHAANTFLSYRDEVEKRIAPMIGHLLISDLRAVHVHAMLSELEKAGTGKRTLVNTYAVLSTAMAFAIRMGVRESNPCDPVTKPKRDPKEIWPFTAEEASEIIKATKDDRLHGLYVLGLNTGMRQGELFGLRRSDIDFDKGQLTVNWQVVECRGHVSIERPKTKSSRRTIAISDEVAESLHGRIRLLIAEGNAGSETIFCTQTGRLMRRSNFGKREWKPLLKSLKLDHRGFHHCRHTAATIMLSAGVRAHVVSRILGHSRPSITLDLYSHFMPADGQNAADAIQRLLG